LDGAPNLVVATDHRIELAVGRPTREIDGEFFERLPTFLGARQRAQDRAAQSDLRNGLTAEKTVYTDSQAYDATATNMKSVESSLDWGGKLTVVVGDAVTTGDNGVVCLETTSKSGTVFSLGDVASGSSAGTYFGKAACPATPTPANVSALGSSW